MSDEAFARRFYSDRAERLVLAFRSIRNVTSSPAKSCTRFGPNAISCRSSSSTTRSLLHSRRAFTCSKAASRTRSPSGSRCRTWRSALGRCSRGRPTGTAVRVEVRGRRLLAGASGPPRQARGRDLEQRTVKFRYWSIYRDHEEERTLNPYALLPENGSWYVIGHDLERDDPDVSRLAHPVRHPLCDAAGARFPAARRIRRRALPRPGGVAVRRHRGSRERRGRPGHRVVGEAGVWRRPQSRRGRRLRDGVRVVDAARALDPPPGRPRDPARAVRSSAGSSSRARALRARRTKGAPPTPAAEVVQGEVDAAVERPAGPVAPERFGVLQSLLAYLLAACGDDREATIPAHELVERFSIAEEQLEEHLSLLQPRQLRRRLLRGLRRAARRRGARRQGAVRRHVPPAAAADAARGARDPPGARVRRADGRRRRAFAARSRAREARGDVRRLRAHADSRTARRRGGRARREADAGDRRAPPRRDRVPEAGGAGGRRRGRSSRTRSSGASPTGTSTRGTSSATRRARTASTACARRRSRGRGLRRARASIPPSCTRDDGAHLVLAERRALGDREGRASARRRRGDRRQVGGKRRVARRRGRLLPRRGDRARAA